MTFLSSREDGYGFYYGFMPGDGRQINVRYERRGANGERFGAWWAYAGGIEVGSAETKDEAERMAVAFLRNFSATITPLVGKDTA